MKRALHILCTVAAFSVTASVALADTTVSCKATKKAEIAALFDRWNSSLAKSPEAVGRNYASDAILLPTLSDKPRLTRSTRQDYFEHFLEGKPKGHIDTRSIRVGCNSAVDAGTYTFRFADGRKVKARYTFTYEIGADGVWLISSHHSSAMPEAESGRH